MTTVSKKIFDTLDGQNIYEYTLTNKNGSFIKVITYGATITSITLNTENGPVDVALGYNTIKDYQKNGGYLGACIGRVGNRIGNARFTLNGKEYVLAVNDGQNHLHGGLRGFDKQIFDIEEIPGGIRASRISPDGEENYPGTLKMSVDYLWDDDDRLTLSYHAVSDKDTIMNLTNHTYFNLSGESDGSVLDHTLTIHASAFTENDGGCLPTGTLLPVEHTPFDFRQPKTIGQDINQEDAQLKCGGGYDHNFCLDGSGMRQIARAASPKTGIVMDVYTDLPGVQFYSGNSLEGQIGKSGAAYVPRSGFCLETQYYPNAMDCKNFPSIILKAGETFASDTVYAFHVAGQAQKG